MTELLILNTYDFVNKENDKKIVKILWKSPYQILLGTDLQFPFSLVSLLWNGEIKPHHKIMECSEIQITTIYICNWQEIEKQDEKTMASLPGIVQSMCYLC